MRRIHPYAKNTSCSARLMATGVNALLRPRFV